MRVFFAKQGSDFLPEDFNQHPTAEDGSQNDLQKDTPCSRIYVHFLLPQSKVAGKYNGMEGGRQVGGFQHAPGIQGKVYAGSEESAHFWDSQRLSGMGGDIPDNLQGGNATSIPVQPGGDGLNIDWGETPLPVKVFWHLHSSYSIFFLRLH